MPNVLALNAPQICLVLFDHKETRVTGQFKAGSGLIADQSAKTLIVREAERYHFQISPGVTTSWLI